MEEPRTEKVTLIGKELLPDKPALIAKAAWEPGRYARLPAENVRFVFPEEDL